MHILNKDFWLNLGSDFTMNCLGRFKDGLDRKCIPVNDAVVLLASKPQRTKERLAGGFSELIADESYTYNDFGKSWTVSGRVTMSMNITSEAFQHNKDTLFGLTFSERFLTVHHAFTQQEKDDWNVRVEAARNMHYEKVITTEDIETKVEMPSEYSMFIEHLSKEFSADSLNSPVSCQDLIKATMHAHAALNKRNQVCVDDLVFVTRIRPYLKNPFSPYDGRIVRLRAKGSSIDEICKAIHKGNYGQQVQRVIKKAELRGILPPSDSHPE